MNKFPVYDQIKNTLTGTTGAESTLTRKHASGISRLNQEHINIIYLLILYNYYITNGETLPEKGNPYNGKTASKGKGVTFKLNLLPDDLQRIIVKYLEIISS